MDNSLEGFGSAPYERLMSDDFDACLETPIADRDEAWEADFLRLLPETQVKVLSPEPREGPDHWPYLMVATGNDANEPLRGVLDWLSQRGIGLAVNPNKVAPDYVFTYGMIWNYRERGEFLTTNAPRATPAKIDLKDRQEVLAGPPSEAYLPTYVRKVIKQFLMDQGVFAPKVLMVSFDKVNYDLCFSIESLKSPPVAEHAGIAEALGWFLPAHYSGALISEKSVPGFGPL